MNHLLLGKSALLPSRSRRVGPPPGAVPPPTALAQRRASAVVATGANATIAKGSRGAARAIVTVTGAASGGETLHWKDAKKRRRSLDISRSADSTPPASATDATTTAASAASSAAATDLARRASEAAAPSSASVDEEDEDSSAVSGGDNDGEGAGEESVPAGGGGSGGGGGRRGRTSRGSSICSSSSSSTELCDEPDRMSDFDSEEPTSLSEAASLSPAAASSPDRSPLAPTASVPEAGSGAPTVALARGSSIPRTVSSFNVLESIAELENSIARCAEELPAPASASAGHPSSQTDLEQSLLVSAASGGTSPSLAPAGSVAPEPQVPAGNPVSPSRGLTLATQSFPSPALAAIPTIPPPPASTLSQEPLIPIPASEDDKDFEAFAQQRLSNSPSAEMKSATSSREKHTPHQTSPAAETYVTPTVASTVETAGLTKSEPFSYLSSTIAKEFARETPTMALAAITDGDQKEAEAASAAPAAQEEFEGAELVEAAIAGRRNSARALRIIQENTEILQRIIQAQQRRSSVSSEQDCYSESAGGSPEPASTPAAAPATVPATPTSATAPGSERRPSGTRRTASPAVSPANSPPASPPPSPASPGAAAATAERGRRILDDISALCNPTSPENPVASHVAPVQTTSASSDATASPVIRRRFSPKTTQFLKSFDELLKPPSPPPTPKAPSPAASPPAASAATELPHHGDKSAQPLSPGVDRGHSLDNLDGVTRGVSPEPPLVRRYTTHFIDALFEPPRTPSPLPTSASATYLSEAAYSTTGSRRSPSTSPTVTGRSSEVVAEKGERETKRLTLRVDERRKTTSYLIDKREVSRPEGTTHERLGSTTELPKSPTRSIYLSKCPERQPEDIRLRSSDTIEESSRYRPNVDPISSEFRRHLRSPSPSSHDFSSAQRQSRSPSRSSDEFGDSRQRYYSPSSARIERSPTRPTDEKSDYRRRSYSPSTKIQERSSSSLNIDHSSEEIADVRRRSYSPSKKSQVDRSPSRSSDELGEFRRRSYSPSSKEQAEKEGDVLKVPYVGSFPRSSSSLVSRTSSEVRNRVTDESRSELDSFRRRSRSPTARRPLTEHLKEGSGLLMVKSDDTRKRQSSPAKKEVTKSSGIEKEGSERDKFDENTRKTYSPDLLVSDSNTRTSPDSAGECRLSFSPVRTTDVNSSRESYCELKKQSYSPSHRAVSIDRDSKTSETCDLSGDSQKPFSQCRRAQSETRDLKQSDSVDLGDLQKHIYPSSKRMPSGESELKKEGSMESLREYRRYHSYSPSRKVHLETMDVRVDSFTGKYDDSYYSPSRSAQSEADIKTRDSEMSISHKKRVYSTTETKKVTYEKYHHEYSPTRQISSDAMVDDYIEEYHDRYYSPTKSIEPEVSDYSYEEYKNQQYSPSEIMELERKARLSIDTSDEYRQFTSTKISPVASTVLGEIVTISYGEFQSKSPPSERRLDFKDDEALRDYHQRPSPSPVQMKSRGSMEILTDYARSSYSPSKMREGDSKSEERVRVHSEQKARSYSPSKRSLSEHKITDIADDYKPSYSHSKRVPSEVKISSSLDLLDDYQRPPYSPSRRSASEIKSDDSLEFLDDLPRRSSPSRKMASDHRKDSYEAYKSAPYSPSKLSTSEFTTGDSLELLDDHSHPSYSPSKKSTSDAKSTSSVEFLDDYPRRSYSPSTKSTIPSKSEDHYDVLGYRHRSKSPPKKMSNFSLAENAERGFGDYKRPTRASASTVDILGDSGGYGDFRRRSDSPARKWQDDNGSSASAEDTRSRDKLVTEKRGGRPEASRHSQGLVVETADTDGGGGRRRQKESSPLASPSATTAPVAAGISAAATHHASKLTTTVAHTSRVEPVAAAVSAAAAADAEQAARPQPHSPETARCPSELGTTVTSAESRKPPPASASVVVSRQHRGAGDSEDSVPLPPPSSLRSGGGVGGSRGSRASSASPRRRRRPDTELLVGCHVTGGAGSGVDVPPYATCCPPYGAMSPLSEGVMTLLPPPAPRSGVRPASPIIGATLEERAPPSPLVAGRRASTSGMPPLTGTAGSPPPSPHFYAAHFHAKPCGGKAFATSASSAFSRYPNRGRDRPTSLLLDGGGAAAAAVVAAFDAAPLYKSLSMLSLGETDLSPARHWQRPSGGKRSPQRRCTSSDLSSEFSPVTSGSAMSSHPTRVPKDLCANLPPLRPSGSSPMSSGSPARFPSTFSPFPSRSSARQPKELGVRLGLYARDAEKS